MRRAFTLIELLVVISIIALLIAILLPALGAARESAQKLQSSTQVRGIHQGFVVYGQSNDGFYPGVNGVFSDTAKIFVHENQIDSISGERNNAGNRVSARIAIALEDDLFTPEYAISPVETNEEVREWEPGNVYSGLNDPLTSYAMLQLTEVGFSIERIKEWRDTMNGRAIVMGDRATRMGIPVTQPAAYESLWSKGKPGWNGTVLFNDNSTQFIFDREFEGTRYGTHTNTLPDNIFIGKFDPNVGVNGGQDDTNCDLVPAKGNNWNALPG